MLRNTLNHCSVAPPAAMIEQLFSAHPTQAQMLLEALTESCAHVETLLAQARYLARSNWIIALGELWSAILAATLVQFGSTALAIDARDFLVAQEASDLLCLKRQRDNCSCGKASSSSICDHWLYLRTQRGALAYLIAWTQWLDYSATLIAQFQCNTRIWSDVKGLYDADPHQIMATFKHFEFAKADKLAELGCPALHGRSLQPLQGMDTKLFMRSSFELMAFTTITLITVMYLTLL